MSLQRVLEIYIQDLEIFGLVEEKDPRIERIKAAYNDRIQTLKEAKARLKVQIQKLKSLKDQISGKSPEELTKKAELLKKIAVLMEKVARIDNRIDTLMNMMQKSIARLA